MSRTIRKMVLIAFLLTANGCSTLGKSVATGAGVGGGLGAAVGALADPGPDGSNRVRNILIGSAAGGAIGAAGGYLVGKNVESERASARLDGKKDAEREMQGRLSATPGEGQPQLVPPKTEARWILDLVRGGTFIPGHFEYVITEPARWEMGR